MNLIELLPESACILKPVVGVAVLLQLEVDNRNTNYGVNPTNTLSRFLEYLFGSSLGSYDLGLFQDVPEKDIKPNNQNNYLYRYCFITKKNNPLLVPVSRKEYLQSLLEYYERERLYFPKLIAKLTDITTDIIRAFKHEYCERAKLHENLKANHNKHLRAVYRQLQRTKHKAHKQQQQLRKSRIVRTVNPLHDRKNTIKSENIRLLISTL